MDTLWRDTSLWSLFPHLRVQDIGLLGTGPHLPLRYHQRRRTRSGPDQNRIPSHLQKIHSALLVCALRGSVCVSPPRLRTQCILSRLAGMSPNPHRLLHGRSLPTSAALATIHIGPTLRARACTPWRMPRCPIRFPKPRTAARYAGSDRCRGLTAVRTTAAPEART